MAYEKQTFLQETLIRFGPEGFEGAHQIWMDRVVDTEKDEIISEQTRPAEPIKEQEIIDLVGDQFVKMANQISALKDELNNATSKKSE